MKNAIYDFTEDILIVSLCGEIDHHNAASIRRETDAADSAKTTRGSAARSR